MLRREEDRLRELKQRHHALSIKHQVQLKERLDALAGECRELDRSMEGMKAVLADLEKRLEYSGIFGEMTDRTMEALTNTWYAYRETTKQLAECEAGIKALEQEYAELGKRLERLRPMREKVERIDRFLKEQDDPVREAAAAVSPVRKSRGNIPLLVPAIFLVAAVAILALPLIRHQDMSAPWFTASGVLALTGVFTALLRAMTKKSDRPDSSDRQLKMLYAEGFTGLGDYLAQKEALLGALAECDRCAQELDACRKKRTYLSERRDGLFRSLAVCLEGFRPVTDDPQLVDDAMEAFRSGFNRFREDDSQAHELRQRIASMAEKKRLLLREASALAKREVGSTAELEDAVMSITYGNAPCRLSPDEQAQVSEQEIREIEEAIKDCEVRIGSLNARLEDAPSRDELADIEEEMNRLGEKKRELEFIGTSIRTARDILKEVGSKIQMSYTAQLNSEMGRILSIITKGR